MNKDRETSELGFFAKCREKAKGFLGRTGSNPAERMGEIENSVDGMVAKIEGVSAVSTGLQGSVSGLSATVQSLYRMNQLLELKLSVLSAEVETRSKKFAKLRETRLSDWLYVRDCVDPHHSCFTYFGLISHLPVTFVDIGANTGISALSAHKCAPSWPIFSVEALEILEPMLELTKKAIEGTGGQFEYVIRAVGDQSARMTMHIPVIRGEYLDTMASLQEGQYDKGHIRDCVASAGQLEEWDGRVESFEVDVSPFDEIAPTVITEYTIVKIDAEGFEKQVLKGMEQFVRSHSPALLIECDDIDAILEVLDSLGYSKQSYYFDPNLAELKEGVSPISEGNYFFFPTNSLLLREFQKGAAQSS